MQFNESQRLALKTYIQNDVTLNQMATTGDYDGVTKGLNALAAGPFIVWQSRVSTDLVWGLVTLKNYTPADEPPSSPSTDLTYSNRAFQCQLKQVNLQLILETRSGILITAKSNVRQALNDCLTSLPSGTNGTLLDAGWSGGNGVRQGIQRSATVAEKVLASGTGTQGSPADLGVFDATNNVYCEGQISVFDIGRIIA